MIAIDYTQLLRLALPEVIVVATALIVMAADLMVLRRCNTRVRFAVAAALASLGCAGAIVQILLAPVVASILNGMLIVNPLTHLVQIALLVLTIFTLLLSVDSTFTEHVGEFILLLLVATAGMMFLVGTQDLLVLFISLELLSLSLYILVAFNKRSAQSWEAALKYYLFGGMSAAFLLFGFSLLYGLSNSTNLTQIAAAIHGPALNPLLVIAIGAAAIGLGFKVAAVPFHFWAPDVYQCAPAPSAAFIASGSKVASFFIFFQVMALGFAGAEGTAVLPHLVRGWVPVLALMAASSMLLGNLVAIRQTSLRRLLAYSAIAHAGYMLLAIVAHTEQSLAALLYYVVTYALATLGAFAVIAVVEQQKGSDQLSELRRARSDKRPYSPLPGNLYSFAGRNSTPGGILRQVLSICHRTCLVARVDGPALAGHPRHRHERRLALLLPASAQARLCCASPRRRRQIQLPDSQPDSYAVVGRLRGAVRLRSATAAALDSGSHSRLRPLIPAFPMRSSAGGQSAWLTALSVRMEKLWRSSFEW